jgi:hypothetical protein
MLYAVVWFSMDSTDVPFLMVVPDAQAVPTLEIPIDNPLYESTLLDFTSIYNSNGRLVNATAAILAKRTTLLSPSKVLA